MTNEPQTVPVPASINAPVLSAVGVPEQQPRLGSLGLATGSDSSDEYQETEEEMMRTEIGNMVFHGWWVWPAKIPRQPGYEYTEWIDYDMKWKTWSRPMCSIWLRLKWLFRRRSPNDKADSHFYE